LLKPINEGSLSSGTDSSRWLVCAGHALPTSVHPARRVTASDQRTLAQA
jgi:hypothetical protein